MNKRKQRSLAAVLSGVVMALAMPPLQLGFLAWFGLIPLLLALEKSESWKEGYLLGLIQGTVFSVGTIYWIAFNSGTNVFVATASMLATAMLLGLTFGVFTLIHRRFLKSFGRSAHFLAPFVWVAWEAAWHHTEFAFPWALLALTQSNYLSMIQLASVGGTATISMWVAAVNGILTAGRDRRITGLVAIIIIGSVWFGGKMRVAALENSLESYPPLAKIALVQGNVDAALKWELGPEYSLDSYLPQTRLIAEEQPDLILWPETAAPVYVMQSGRWRKYFQSFVDSLGIPLITGGRYAEFTKEGRVPHNPAFLILPGNRGAMLRYSKMILVPMGERVPLQWIIPALGDLNFGQAEFKPGEKVEIWKLQGQYGQFAVAPNICFESVFPAHLRRSVAEGAQVELNLTNDGWYNYTSGPWQHLMLSRIAAVETGRAVVRATNTGISAIISPSGRILKFLPEGVRGAAVSEIPQAVDTTFNAWGWRIGDVIHVLVLVMGLYLAVSARIAAWRSRNGDA